MTLPTQEWYQTLTIGVIFNKFYSKFRAKSDIENNFMFYLLEPFPVLCDIERTYVGSWVRIIEQLSIIILEWLDNSFNLGETLDTIYNNPEIDLNARHNLDVTLSVCLMYNFSPKVAYRLLKRYTYSKLWCSIPKGEFTVLDKDSKHIKDQHDIVTVYQLNLRSDLMHYTVEYVNTKDNTCTWSWYVTKGLICSHIFYWNLYHEKKLSLDQIREFVESPVLNRLPRTEGFFDKAKNFANEIRGYLDHI